MWIVVKEGHWATGTGHTEVGVISDDTLKNAHTVNDRTVLSLITL